MKKARIIQVGNRYALVLPGGTFQKLFDFLTPALIWCAARGIPVEVA